ncbi:hypothetical protein CRUP_002469 [Coryphaenoides rupestris]|nr:hypothetical protein CRUP_002469 [Coryphaenoides rupestris]
MAVNGRDGVAMVSKHQSQIGDLKRPQVSLLQRTPSSPVVCRATGFYPDRVFWTRDDQELYEHVIPREVLPNHDGTFQVSVDLDLSSVPEEDWGRYRCVFQLEGIEDIVTRLDPSLIMSNWVKTGAHQGRVMVVMFVLEMEWVLSTGQDKNFTWHCSESGQQLGTHRTATCGRVIVVMFVLEMEWVLSTGQDKNFTWHCSESGQQLGTHRTATCRSTIPLMGFEFEVRVCDSCHESITDEDRAPTASFHDSKHSIVHIHYEATTGNLLTSGTDKVIKLWDMTPVVS